MLGSFLYIVFDLKALNSYPFLSFRKLTQKFWNTSKVAVNMSQEKYVCTLSPELLEKAMRELNEDPNTRHLEIKALRERLEQVRGDCGKKN